MIRFLHIIRDDKFAEQTIKGFDKKHQIESKYILFQKKARLKYLKENQRVIIYRDKKQFVKEIESDKYDVLFFHSLSPVAYWMINYIPSDKVVIWWAWGYDIYGGVMGARLFLQLDGLKKQTKILSKNKNIKRLCRDFIGKIWISSLFSRYHKKIIRRINYFEPVRNMDYQLMCEQVPGFSAKEFYSYYGNHGNKPLWDRSTLKNQSILIGNSATLEENHVDVWESIKGVLPQNMKVIIPLSYGDKEYAQKVKARISTTSVQIDFLDTFLPREEYFALVNNCAYAFFGSIRQHAMGNIYHALNNDIKVFLYKDSVMYDYLINMGFVVYAIEDVNINCFCPITEEEHNQNMIAFEREDKYRKEKFDKAMEEIEEMVRCKRLERNNKK